MEPKDKAKELVDKFKEATFKMDHYAIQCAIITAEQMLTVLTRYTAKWYYWQSVLIELKSM